MISNSKMEDELVYCSKCNTQVLQDNLKSHEEGCKQTRQLPVVGKCSYCQKPYKRKKALEDHEIKCKKKIIPKEKCKKPRRSKIHQLIRKRVWETHIGQKTRSLCFCCFDQVITPFTYCNTFQAGHIVSYANGGKDIIDNLLPICRDCNMNMSDENWDDYVERHLHLFRSNQIRNRILIAKEAAAMGVLWLLNKQLKNDIRYKRIILKQRDIIRAFMMRQQTIQHQ